MRAVYTIVVRLFCSVARLAHTLAFPTISSFPYTRNHNLKSDHSIAVCVYYFEFLYQKNLPFSLNDGRCLPEKRVDVEENVLSLLLSCQHIFSTITEMRFIDI